MTRNIVSFKIILRMIVKCFSKYYSRDLIHNTSFTSYSMNSPSKIECYIALSLPGKNTLAYWPQTKVITKIKCYKYDSCFFEAVTQRNNFQMLVNKNLQVNNKNKVDRLPKSCIFCLI